MKDMRNDITKHPVGISIMEESKYIYEIDEGKNFILTKKPEDSKLPESTNWEGLVVILSTSSDSILIISENKYYFRKHF